MAIIDPEGLFEGERLAACSDIAQLYWQRLFLGANSCARMELSYQSIISKIFKTFRKVPTQQELWEVFEEFDKHFLAILYEVDGIWWCQFITSEKNLPKYKKTRDMETPAPTAEMFAKHRSGYMEWRKRNSFSNQSFRKSSEGFQRRGEERGGVGLGVGEEKGGEAKSAPLRQEPIAAKRDVSPLPAHPAKSPPYAAIRPVNESSDGSGAFEHAGKIFAACALPHDFHVQRSIAAAIEAVAEEHAVPIERATEMLIKSAAIAREQAVAVGRFWFLDGRYKKYMQPPKAKRVPDAAERQMAEDQERLRQQQTAGVVQ
jgi:hypothetical protein